jgi:hypothetical protein
MIQGLPSLAKMALGPSRPSSSLALQRCSARPRQLLHLLLPAHAYSYRREDLHKDAMQDLIDSFQFN